MRHQPRALDHIAEDVCGGDRPAVEGIDGGWSAAVADRDEVRGRDVEAVLVFEPDESGHARLKLRPPSDFHLGGMLGQIRDGLEVHRCAVASVTAMASLSCAGDGFRIDKSPASALNSAGSTASGVVTVVSSSKYCSRSPGYAPMRSMEWSCTAGM